MMAGPPTPGSADAWVRRRNCVVANNRKTKEEGQIALFCSSPTFQSLLFESSLTRIGSTEGTICAYFVPSVDPATQFVPILGPRRTRSADLIIIFPFCVLCPQLRRRTQVHRHQVPNCPNILTKHRKLWSLVS